MFIGCREYLVSKLSESGMKTKPYTSLKKLKLTQESHVCAVLFDEELYTRNGSKTIYEDDRGDRKKREKVFDRSLSFSVVIADYAQENTEKIFDSFIRNLDRGIIIDGNFVYIEPDTAEWVDDEDSILKAKIAVQLKVKFEGGVYKDTGYKNISDIDTKFEKED